MKKIFKAITFLMCLLLVFSLLPVSILAVEPAVIEAGQSVSAVFPYSYDYDENCFVIEFTPKNTNVYIIYSESEDDADVKAAIFDDLDNLIAEDDDEGGNGQFYIEQTLVADETYKIKCISYEDGENLLTKVTVLEKKKADSVSFERYSVSPTAFYVGTQATLVPVADKGEYFTDNLSISSSDESVIFAKKVGTGNFTLNFIRTGSATITVSDDALNESFLITVTEPKELTLGIEYELQEAIKNYDGYKFTVSESGTYTATYYGSSRHISMSLWEDSRRIKGTNLDTDGVLVDLGLLEAGKTYTLLHTKQKEDIALSGTMKVKRAVTASEISIVLDNLSYTVGQKFYPMVEFKPDGSSDQAYTFTSDNQSVITVNGHELFAVGAGKATITVTSQLGLSDSIEVIVSEVPDVTLGNEITLDFNDTDNEKYVTFTAPEDGLYTIYSLGDFDADLTGVYDTTGYYYGSDTNSGVGNNFSYVVELTKGTKISFGVACYFDGDSAQVTVGVDEAKAAESIEIVIDGDKDNLFEQNSYSIDCIFLPNGAVREDITYQSSNTDVIEVIYDFGRVIRCKKAGTATITATTEKGLTASVTLTVKEIDEIQLDQKHSLHFAESGQKGSITVKFTPQEDGVYYFTSFGDNDTVGALYRGISEIETDDDNGRENNFFIRAELEGGKTYALKTYIYEGNDTGEVTIMVSTTLKAAHIEVISPPNKLMYYSDFAREGSYGGLEILITLTDGTQISWNYDNSSPYIEELQRNVELSVVTDGETLMQKIKIDCGAVAYIDLIKGNADINGDGDDNVTDLATLKLYLAGARNITMVNGDINEDGKVDIQDLAVLKIYLANK